MKISKEIKIGIISFVVLILCVFSYTFLSKVNNTVEKVDTVIKVVEDNVSEKEFRDGVKTTIVVATEVADSTRSKILKMIRK